MPIAVRSLALDLDEPEELLVQRAARRLKVPVDAIRHWAVMRRAIDARDKTRIRMSYNLELTLTGGSRQEKRVVGRLHRRDVTLLEPEPQPVIEPGSQPLEARPIVVGFGPAGMFAGLLLARFGYRPLILERGPDVSTRHRDILVDFYRHGRFHPESNLLFGEGGAGTYSDGKLYTRVRDPRVRFILETFYHHGAAPDVLIDARPHIGSDKLPGICRRIRERIRSLGGEVRFAARVDDLVVHQDRVCALIVNGQPIDCGPVILAIGHSARDTLRMLARRGISLAVKPFQVGVRIEHPQEMVNRWQYGAFCTHPRLPPAEYHLVAKGAAGLHGDVFSFCMCPGGMILPTNESPGLISTNGASRSRREGGKANSGLVLTVEPVDVCPEARTDPTAVLNWVERIERAAFAATGGSYRVPTQRAGDFVKNRRSDGRLDVSYPLGGEWVELRSLLPSWMIESIARAIVQLDERMPGFGGDEALVTAPESRAGGPIRIPRDPRTRASVSAENLYPVGEGAGYAGGIISAAIDGLKTAERIIARYQPAQ